MKLLACVFFASTCTSPAVAAKHHPRHHHHAHATARGQAAPDVWAPTPEPIYLAPRANP
jgi:hypothetical protein